MPIADQLTVLIAEDDPQLLDLIATTFQVFGLAVIKASDGKKAWETLQKEKVDIVVTDVRMPNATGIELLKWIRKKDIESPKVFFMTGYSDYPWDEIFENGADGLFLKPFDTKTVLDALRKCVLSRTDRWSSQPAAAQLPTIQTKFEADGFELEGRFRLGRGGFFLAIDKPMVAINQMVAFNLPFGKKSAVKGVGYVRWVYPNHSQPAGSPSHRIGVEIISLEDDCRPSVIQWIEAHQGPAYIPNH